MFINGCTQKVLQIFENSEKPVIPETGGSVSCSHCPFNDLAFPFYKVSQYNQNLTLTIRAAVLKLFTQVKPQQIFEIPDLDKDQMRTKPVLNRTFFAQNYV